MHLSGNVAIEVDDFDLLWAGHAQDSANSNNDNDNINNININIIYIIYVCLEECPG